MASLPGRAVGAQRGPVNELALGLACGAFMASIFVTLGAWAVVRLADDPPTVMLQLLERHSPMRLVMPVVLLSYPVWGAAGMLLGLLFLASENEAPGGGLGSPNMFYTMVVVAIAVLAMLPALLLVRPARLQTALTGACFAGVFGWMLPYFAT